MECRRHNIRRVVTPEFCRDIEQLVEQYCEYCLLRGLDAATSTGSNRSCGPIAGTTAEEFDRLERGMDVRPLYLPRIGCGSPKRFDANRPDEEWWRHIPGTAAATRATFRRGGT